MTLGAAALLFAVALLDVERPLAPPVLDAPAQLIGLTEPVCDRWSLLAGVGQERGAEVAIYTDGLAVLSACGEEERELALRGTSARGEGAHAVVVDAEGVRFAGYVDGELTLRVVGDLRVAFTNDLATQTEDRNLYATLR